MNPEAEIWTFQIKNCNSWVYVGDKAWVEASNYLNDSLDFIIAIHPEGYAIAYEIDADFHSDNFYPFQSEEVVNKYLIDDIDKYLKEWQSEIIKLREELKPDYWPNIKGIAADEKLYSAIAALYSKRAEVGERAITEALAVDMKVSDSTAKERIRKARDKGFLSRPGRGAGGQAEITKKAIKNREERGKK